MASYEPKTYRSLSGENLPIPEAPAKARKVTPEEVLEALKDMAAREQSAYLVPSHGKLDIARHLLDDYDPSFGKQVAGYVGGKSRDGWFREHLSIGSLKTALESLVAQGAVVEVPKGRTGLGRLMGETEAMSFISRFPTAGVTFIDIETFNKAAAKAGTEQRNTQRKRLKAQAIEMLCTQHADELASIHQALCDADGLGTETEAA